MATIEYVVRIVCDTSAHLERMHAWLAPGHMADVVRAGARSASLARFDDAPLTLEVRYVFDSREAFAAYERDHAPRLRAEGQRLFPEGVRFERRLGEVVHEACS